MNNVNFEWLQSIESHWIEFHATTMVNRINWINLIGLGLIDQKVFNNSFTSYNCLYSVWMKSHFMSDSIKSINKRTIWNFCYFRRRNCSSFGSDPFYLYVANEADSFTLNWSHSRLCAFQIYRGITNSLWIFIAVHVQHIILRSGVNEAIR